MGHSFTPDTFVCFYNSYMDRTEALWMGKFLFI